MGTSRSLLGLWALSGAFLLACGGPSAAALQATISAQDDLLDAHEAAIARLEATVQSQRRKLVELGVETPEPVATPVPGRETTHTVGSGDTLSGIAQRYGTSVEAIVAANSLANPNELTVGHVLRIPAGQ